ncbi:MAG: AhpC/TSA family protein [Bacteroidales bacterium]|nr:AhpC/TSA family protein [Bacteroidales bacterium]
MKRTVFIAAWAVLTACLGGCKSESCTVQGTVQGVRDGAALVLVDAWNKFKVISSTTVEDGTFEFRPRFSTPTHAYLYAEDPKDVIANPYDGGQLKDFILEPGTISVDVRAEDDTDMFTGASGTVLNDAYRRIMSATEDAREALWEEVTRDGATNLLTLMYAEDNIVDPARALEILDRLPPEVAKSHRSFVARLKRRCARALKAEERRKQAGQSPEDTLPSLEYYIDMEFPDTDGQTVSLGSVVRNPANRYVLLDFWATWCGPCVASIPMLKEVYGKYHAKGLEIFSVSLDSKDKAWKSFVAENGMTWVNVSGRNRKASKAYGVEYIPTVFLIDCETGRILLRDGHPDLEAVLSDLLP